MTLIIGCESNYTVEKDRLINRRKVSDTLLQYNIARLVMS